jgi:hypothetical protein
VKRANASHLGKAGIAIPKRTASPGGRRQSDTAAIAHDSEGRWNVGRALREQKYALDPHAIVAATKVQGKPVAAGQVK